MGIFASYQSLQSAIEEHTADGTIQEFATDAVGYMLRVHIMPSRRLWFLKETENKPGFYYYQHWDSLLDLLIFQEDCKNHQDNTVRLGNYNTMPRIECFHGKDSLMDFMEHRGTCPRSMTDVFDATEAENEYVFVTTIGLANKKFLIYKNTYFLDQQKSFERKTIRGGREATNDGLMMPPQLMPAFVQFMKNYNTNKIQVDNVAILPQYTVVLKCAVCPKSELDGLLKFCTGCMKVRYCGINCQTLHWRSSHQQECSGFVS